MENHIAVNALRIEQDRGSLNDSVMQVAQRMNELGSKVEVLKQNWQGDASAAFLQTVSEDFQLMSELLSEIAAYSQALLEAEREYLNCEYEVQARIDYLGV